MGKDATIGTSAERVETFVTGYVAEHGSLPSVAQVSEGGVRARTATIASVLREARAAAARERALDAASPDAVEAIMEVGRAMARAAQRALDEEVASLVERLTAPVRSTSDEAVAAAHEARDAARAELTVQEELRAAERDALERVIDALREDVASIGRERDDALRALDQARAERDRAASRARDADAEVGEAQRALTEAEETARAALHRADVALAEERGRRLAAEARNDRLEAQIAAASQRRKDPRT